MESAHKKRSSIFVGIVLATVFLFGFTATTATAHGCGTADHQVAADGPWGFEIHYYEGHYDSGNSHFHNWREVSFGGAGIVPYFCGCINPSQPCYHAP